MSELNKIALKILSNGKGILAADESNGTMTKRLEEVEIKSTPESRLAFRETLFKSEAIKNYIGGTYDQHYSTTKDGFQVQDMLRQLDIDKDFCQANAIKYLCRYGKKDGKNRKDLLKAIHYIVLLMSSEDGNLSEEQIKQQIEGGA